MQILFDDKATSSSDVEKIVQDALAVIHTLEQAHQMPIIIFQDGVNGAYYIKCSVNAQDATELCDLDARLIVNSGESYRANRSLLLTSITYLKMETDAETGREFNDIIVEYNLDYTPTKPLKVWGGQHRISAISKASKKSNRYHGFRIYFNLTKEQRADVSFISNAVMAFSKDTFDRMYEEAYFGDALRKWCKLVGLLNHDEDFPDVGSRSDRITVKKARSFIVNFYLGVEEGKIIPSDKLDHQVYNPYLTVTGAVVDPKYAAIMKAKDILNDQDLIKAGKHFTALHNAQSKAVLNSNGSIKNAPGFRNKALVESVICGWSFVAGLLQSHPDRLGNHYLIPKTNNKVPDPLNAEEMSKFKYDEAEITSRGLGTRSSPKDRQRIAQLFLARSLQPNSVIDTKLMYKAVGQVVGLLNLKKGYA